MERIDLVRIVAPLLLAYRQSFDAGQWGAYQRALDDVPAVLLEQAVERALKGGGAFLPKPAELRQFAEDARKALLVAHPFEPCEMCSVQGWTETVIDGVRRMTRCSCWHAHQQTIARLGVGYAPLALPAPDVRYEAEA